MDERRTSKSELRAWYAYAFASEVFVVLSVGTYIPITLEALAAQSGVRVSDGRPCTDPRSDESRCLVRFLGLWWVDTASFVLYVYSLGVLLQGICAVAMSGAADHGFYRKRLLLFFSTLGSMAAMLMAAVPEAGSTLAGLLAIISIVSVGASTVCMNAFLPILIQHHPQLDLVATEDRHAKALQLSTQVSSRGIAFGFTSAVTMQALSILFVIAHGSSVKSFQLVIMMSGIWWFVFMLPTAYWLRPRPGPPLEATCDSSLTHTTLFVKNNLRMLWTTIDRARNLRDVVVFLCSWFLMSDAFAVITSVSILFAKTTLHMSPASLAVLGILMTLFGIIGAFAWPKLNKDLQRTVSLMLSIALFIPLYGLLGLLESVRDLKLGLTQPYEIYILASLFGFLYGGLLAIARSIYSQLIPVGFETGFFALYSITGKNSSAIGTFISALIITLAGDIRATFGLILVMLIGAIAAIRHVSVDRGQKAAKTVLSSPGSA